MLFLTNNKGPTLIVLVMACLGGRFGINCPSAFLKILKLPEKKKMRDLSRKLSEPKCGYWLITPNLKTLCIEINIFFNSGKLQISERTITK